MPVHDWTRVDAGVFHHFHHGWIEEIKRALNRGTLPASHYAMVEQITSRQEPGFLSLAEPTRGNLPERHPLGTLSLAASPPKVCFRDQAAMEFYATRAKAVVIRHASGHEVIAVVEIVSQGNKNNWHG